MLTRWLHPTRAAACCMLVLAASSAPLQGQGTGVALGDTVRLTNATPVGDFIAHVGDRWEGVVTGAGSGHVQLAVGDQTQALRIDSGTRIEVRRGSRAWGPIKGALLGTLTAVVTGAIWVGSASLEDRGCVPAYTSVSGSSVYRCDEPPRRVDESWIVGGALVGFTVGYAIRVPRWRDATGTAPSVGVAAAAGGRAAVSVRVPLGDAPASR